MRILLGMILGVLLAVGAAYFHDSMDASPRVGGRAAAGPPATIVNWEVAGARWQDFRRGWTAVKTRAYEGWAAVSAPVRR
jgi:hypothetical protein